MKTSLKGTEGLAVIAEPHDEPPSAVVAITRDGRVRRWNAAAIEFFGIDAADAIGLPYLDLVVPESAAADERAHLAFATDAGFAIFESVRHRKDGLLLYVEVSARTAVDSDDGSLLLVLNERDITRARYVRDAQSLQARFRGVLDAAPDAIVLVDDTGRIALANTETERLFGYAREELLGTPVEVLVPERFRDSHPRFRTSYFHDPRRRPMGSGLELSGRRKDATEFPVEISLSPLLLDESTLAMAVIRDVTVRRKGEAKLRGLLEAAPDAMVTVNAQGLITLVNSQTEQLFGYSRDELLGKPVELLVPGRFVASHPTHREKYFQDPHRRPMGSGLRLTGRRKDDTEVPVEISLSPVETEEGTLVTAAIRDITDRLRMDAMREEMAARRAAAEALTAHLEHRVAERTAQLERANEELEAFTYSVSHDLRAPLRQIDGFARLLEELCGTALEPKAQHYLRRIHEGAKHMGRLVDDLLHLARVGRQEVYPRAIALESVVSAVVSDLQHDLMGRDIEWRIGPLPTLECDPGLMKVAFTNLLSNAVKYTRSRERAVIEVGEAFTNGRSVIFVRDNGVGFDMRYADKLFGVFQRLHHADEFEGAGVGLATVKRIVSKHGGEIWADAAPAGGATFYFTVGSPPPNSVPSEL